MLVINEEHYSSEHPFAQILQVLKKTEAERIAEMTRFSVKSSLKKYDYICHLAYALEHGTDYWISDLPRYEVELLKKILECPKGEGVTMYLPQQDIILGNLCVIVGKREDEDRLFTLYLMTEKLRECLEKALEDNEKKIEEDEQDKLWENLVVGLLNYFGLMPLSELNVQMKRRAKIEDEEVFLNWLSKKILFHNSCVIVREGSNTRTYLRSAMLKDVDAMFKEWDLRHDLKPDYDMPTNEQLMAYGILPFMTPFSKEDKAMYDYLVKEQKMSKEKADWVFSELWRREQMSNRPTEAISWLNKIGTFTSLEQVNRLVEVQMRFSNNMPKWSLYGHSSEELLKKSQKPKLQPLPQMPRMPVMPAGGKVGRNDPCPCGSGKKYKNCCGK